MSGDQRRVREGVLCALGAYTMWGVVPIYFKAVSHVSPIEVLCHRVVWSFLFLASC